MLPLSVSAPATGFCASNIRGDVSDNWSWSNASFAAAESGRGVWAVLGVGVTAAAGVGPGRAAFDCADLGCGDGPPLRKNWQMITKPKITAAPAATFFLFC